MQCGYFKNIEFTLQNWLKSGETFVTNISALLAKRKCFKIGAIFHDNISNIGQDRSNTSNTGPIMFF